MENIDDLEKEMNANAELARIDKEIEKLTGQWHDAKADHFLMYFAELGDGRTHGIRIHTSNNDIMGVCVHMLRDIVDKQPEGLRKAFVVTIIKTITAQLI